MMIPPTADVQGRAVRELAACNFKSFAMQCKRKLQTCLLTSGKSGMRALRAQACREGSGQAICRQILLHDKMMAAEGSIM